MKALPNATGPQFTLTPELFEQGIQGSRESRRKRLIYPIHRKQDATVQRMLNFLQPGTYIQPHMHPRPHAIESLVLLQGSIRFLHLDAKGKVEDISILEQAFGRTVLDIEPLVWHSFTVLQEDTVLFECKMGPYDVRMDKTFAEWAPDEGQPGCTALLRRMESAAPGDSLQG